MCVSMGLGARWGDKMYKTPLTTSLRPKSTFPVTAKKKKKALEAGNALSMSGLGVLPRALAEGPQVLSAEWCRKSRSQNVPPDKVQ